MKTTNGKYKTCKKCQGTYKISTFTKEWSAHIEKKLEIGLCYHCDKRCKK